MIIFTCYHKVNMEKKEGKAKVVTWGKEQGVFLRNDNFYLLYHRMNKESKKDEKEKVVTQTFLGFHVCVWGVGLSLYNVKRYMLSYRVNIEKEENAKKFLGGRNKGVIPRQC